MAINIVATGRKPAEAKRGASGGKSFGALAERYLEEHARRRKRSHAVDQRNLKNHVLPKWKNRAYASIKRADVIELVEGLVSNVNTDAGQIGHIALSVPFSLWRWTLLVEFSQKRGQENVGRRVLSDERLLFGIALSNCPTPRAGMALRLALLTGARVSEFAGISREELDLIEANQITVWIIPPSREEWPRPFGAALVNSARDCA